MLCTHHMHSYNADHSLQHQVAWYSACTNGLPRCIANGAHDDTCTAGDGAFLEQVKQLIPRLSYGHIQDNPFAEGASADVSEDAQDIVPLVIDAILGFCHAQLCDFTSAFPQGTRRMRGAVEVMRVGLHSRGDPTGIAQVCVALPPRDHILLRMIMS